MGKMDEAWIEQMGDDKMKANGMRMTVFKTDGTVEQRDIWPVSSRFEVLGEVVGGWVEHAFFPAFGNKQSFFFNEDGKLKGLDPNPFFFAYQLVGNVVMIDTDDWKDAAKEGNEE